MIIYLDLVFLYNFLIDWMLLWSVAYLLKLRPRWYRLSLGAGVGAFYTLFLFLPPLSIFYTFSSKLVLACLMVLSVFGYQRLRVFLIRLLLFYLVSFVLGGGLFGIRYLLESESEILSGIIITHSGGMGGSITWSFLLVGFPFLWFLSGKGLKEIRHKEKKYSYSGEIEAIIGETKISCMGLLDTGNQLYEPITRIPVVIMEVDLFREILPEQLYHVIKEQKDVSSDLSFMQVDELWLGRIRIIPYRSVSRGMDLLIALRPDVVMVRMPEGTFETKRILIGLNALQLSSEGDYRAIIHPDIVQESALSIDSKQSMGKEAI